MALQDFRSIVASCKRRAHRGVTPSRRGAFSDVTDDPRTAFLKGQISAFNFFLQLFDCVADGTIHFLPDESLEADSRG